MKTKMNDLSVAVLIFSLGFLVTMLVFLVFPANLSEQKYIHKDLKCSYFGEFNGQTLLICNNKDKQNHE